MLLVADEAFTRRLIQVVDEAGGQNALARKTGLAQSGIARLVKGGEPTLSTLKSIANASGRSLLWLTMGDIDSARPAERSDAADVVMIPILDVVAAAGAGRDNQAEAVLTHMPFSHSFLRRLGVSSQRVKAIRAGGDSMEPTVADNALVLVDEGARELLDGRVYALRAVDGLRIKRIQRAIGGGVMLISDNRERYPVEQLAASNAAEIDVVGRVFWTERLL